MDILQPLPIEKWNELKGLLKNNWPAYSYYHNYVENSIKWKTKDPSLKIEFYCPNGTTDAGVFIGKSDHGYKDLVIFSIKESKGLLREVLHGTNRINWSDTCTCACVHENFSDIVIQFLNDHAKSKGLQHYTYSNCSSYFRSKEDCLKTELQIPEECELKRIDETYVSQIHSVWPLRDAKRPEQTLEILTTIAKLNGGYGLFLKKDNCLVSWIFQCNYGGLAILQTLEEHKRKGYGKTVTRAQMKYLAEKENLDVTSFVVQENKISQQLFESSGFKSVTTTDWFALND